MLKECISCAQHQHQHLKSVTIQIVLTHAYFVVEKSDYSDASLLWLMALGHRFSRVMGLEICGPRRRSSIYGHTARHSRCNRIFSTDWRMTRVHHYCPVERVYASWCCPWPHFCYVSIQTWTWIWGFPTVLPSICRLRHEYYIYTTRHLQAFERHIRPVAVLLKIWRAGFSSCGRQQRLNEITIEPIENWGAVPPWFQPRTATALS